MRVHRTFEGGWASCFDDACPLIFHFDDMSVEVAEAMPMQVLLPLLNVLQPPDLEQDGELLWLDEDRQYHRDYDLPSSVSAEGMCWSQHGLTHRDDDLPAWIGTDGSREWHLDGQLHRKFGPAVINRYGESFWYLRGDQVGEPLPDNPDYLRP